MDPPFSHVDVEIEKQYIEERTFTTHWQTMQFSLCYVGKTFITLTRKGTDISQSSHYQNSTVW